MGVYDSRLFFAGCPSVSTPGSRFTCTRDEAAGETSSDGSCLMSTLPNKSSSSKQDAVITDRPHRGKGAQLLQTTKPPICGDRLEAKWLRENESRPDVALDWRPKSPSTLIGESLFLCKYLLRCCGCSLYFCPPPKAAVGQVLGPPLGRTPHTTLTQKTSSSLGRLCACLADPCQQIVWLCTSCTA